MDEAKLSLGEAPHSYGYGSTGRASCNDQFNSYGEPYGPGDVLGCFVVSNTALYMWNTCMCVYMYMYIVYVQSCM